MHKRMDTDTQLWTRRPLEADVISYAGLLLLGSGTGFGKNLAYAAECIPDLQAELGPST